MPVVADRRYPRLATAAGRPSPPAAPPPSVRRALANARGQREAPPHAAWRGCRVLCPHFRVLASRNLPVLPLVPGRASSGPQPPRRGRQSAKDTRRGNDGQGRNNPRGGRSQSKAATNKTLSCSWSFYIFSCDGGSDELSFRDFDLEFFQEFGVFGHFLT